jgi:NADPH-dependent 2,4-dienoyl-CoA reductase/sulfur reductase-like enzyme
MAVNDLFWPFLGAGFYYKTFMWPRAFWEGLYEPIIRRAAGLGRMTKGASPEANERAFAHCDVLVIGAGPTGLMAALTAAEAGADVILPTRTPRSADGFCRRPKRSTANPATCGPGRCWRDTASMDNVRIMTRTTVTGVYDDLNFGALERVGQHLPHEPGPAARMLLAHPARKVPCWPPARWSGPSPSR